MPDTREIPVRHYRVKTKLRQRLGIPAGLSEIQAPFDGADMLAANSVLTRLSAEFPKHGLAEIEKLRASIAANPVTAQNIGQIRYTAHDLAGQGGTFGFPLVTQTAKSLYRLLATDEAPSTMSLELIRTHIQLLQLIFNKNYKGADQQDVQKALKGLEIAVDKALQK
jgi:HPt (histidine-containing phosphotransfer) domain-containing protein